MFSVRNYIQNARKKITTVLERHDAYGYTRENDTGFTFVVGNESADMDSVACAIVMGFVYEGIPVIRIEKHDLKLRKDVKWILEQFGIGEDDLVYWKDVETISTGYDRYVLVDHNCANYIRGSGKDVTSSESPTIPVNIIEVIDHHIDAKSNKARRCIKPVASCATLVHSSSTCLKDVWDSVGWGYSVFPAELNPEFSILLLSAILLDTCGLTYKVTEDDMNACQQLKKMSKDLLCSDRFIDGISDDVDRAALKLYRKLQSLRDDPMDDLSLYDRMRCDYKEYSVVLESKKEQSIKYPYAITLLRASWASIKNKYGWDGIERAISTMMLNRNAYMIIIMFLSTELVNGEEVMVRELFVPASDIRYELELRKWIEADVVETSILGVIYRQKDTNLSRKQIQPLIEEALLSWSHN